MDNQIHTFRLYLDEKLRKFLGINLINRYLYFFQIDGHAYLSSNVIPKNKGFKPIKVILGYNCFYVNIPVSIIGFEPVSYKLLNVHGKVLELIPDIEK